MSHPWSRPRRRLSRCLMPLLTMSLLGCGQYPGLGPTGAKAVEVGHGPAYASVRLNKAAYRALATAHRWELDDVYTVTIELLVRDAQNAFVPLATPQAVTLDLKAAPEVTSATFSALAHGYYRVSLTAHGAPTEELPAGPALNATPVTADLDLLTALSATVEPTLTLDPVPFEATGKAQGIMPTENGPFVGGDDPETIVVEDPEPTATDTDVPAEQP